MSQNGAPIEDVIEPQPSPWTPVDQRDKEVIREQIGRIVSNALFRNSKRFPAFLRYTVEHALESRDGLKERTIGHEVFGRDAAYDTAQDPIVRMTAAEVRKRLGQYYQSPEHAGETVIAYQTGSYVPEFFLPQAPSARTHAPSGSSRWPVPVPGHGCRCRGSRRPRPGGFRGLAGHAAWSPRSILGSSAQLTVAGVGLHRRSLFGLRAASWIPCRRRRGWDRRRRDD